MARTWSPTQDEANDRASRAARAAAVDRKILLDIVATPGGRKFVWDLLNASGVLRLQLEHSTAMTQAGLVALRDFGMQHLLQPLLTECPHQFLEMKAENDRSTADG